ncbi:uncharacterized protein MICPUCDRAFT_68795 [Micromonas pusilla CCMP1545]|uniref:Predicted protein n=1 Tax=Micromonas pusilla (strain CCMP1545) TaxID=564608 RepID=C1N419_MICPC|nr:uncharacterized protein MICPUCDRAFT_68795 [Micromonas pusilla CCMP1545]EEH53287.1 predicted protein [Micromonas pusilla CCMP1545]|eukprot:XP_003062468.1 predicted protein [Micromonas pusilla CCMP1545]
MTFPPPARNPRRRRRRHRVQRSVLRGRGLGPAPELPERRGGGDGGGPGERGARRPEELFREPARADAAQRAVRRPHASARAFRRDQLRAAHRVRGGREPVGGRDLFLEKRHGHARYARRRSRGEEGGGRRKTESRVSRVRPRDARRGRRRESGRGDPRSRRRWKRRPRRRRHRARVRVAVRAVRRQGQSDIRSRRRARVWIRVFRLQVSERLPRPRARRRASRPSRIRRDQRERRPSFGAILREEIRHGEQRSFGREPLRAEIAAGVEAAHVRRAAGDARDPAPARGGVLRRRRVGARARRRVQGRGHRDRRRRRREGDTGGERTRRGRVRRRGDVVRRVREGRRGGRQGAADGVQLAARRQGRVIDYDTVWVCLVVGLLWIHTVSKRRVVPERTVCSRRSLTARRRPTRPGTRPSRAPLRG